MFKPKSVEKIMKNFHQAMEDLRFHAENAHQRADLLESEAEEIHDLSVQHREEAAKALKIHANLEKLLESAA